MVSKRPNIDYSLTAYRCDLGSCCGFVLRSSYRGVIYVSWWLTVDGSEIRWTTWDVWKTLVNHGDIYHLKLVSWIYEPSTVSMVLQQIALHLQMREIEPNWTPKTNGSKWRACICRFFQRKLIERELFAMISWVEELQLGLLPIGLHGMRFGNKLE